MAQRLGALAAILEDLGSIPSTHRAACNCNSGSRGYAYACRENTYNINQS